MAVERLSQASILTLNKYSAMMAGSSFADVANYWIALFGGSAGADSGNRVVYDSSNNSYTVGGTSSTGTDYVAQVIKRSTTGAIIWQRGFISTSNTYSTAIALDSSGNVYVGGYSAAGTAGAIIAKYNSSGVLQWQKTIATLNISAIYVDSSGLIYVGAGSDIVKMTADAGAISWNKQVFWTDGTTTRYVTVYSVYSDSSGNVWMTGDGNMYDTGTRAAVTYKYNSAGTRQLNNAYRSSQDNNGGTSRLDGAGNMYLATQTNSVNPAAVCLVKFDVTSSQTLTWQTSLAPATQYALSYGQDVAFDSSGNVYLAAKMGVSSSGTYQILIAKFNSAGTIQWQRSFSHATKNVVVNGIAIDSTGAIVISGYTDASNVNDLLNLRLPNDGSLTGTYVVGGYTFVYAASSFTVATPSCTNINKTQLSDSAPARSLATQTLTDSATTITDTKTAIG